MRIEFDIDDNEIAKVARMHASRMLEPRGYSGETDMGKLIESRTRAEVVSAVNRGAVDAAIANAVRACIDRIAQEEAERIVRQWARKRVKAMDVDALRQLTTDGIQAPR